MTKFLELRKINVNEFVEKKGKFTYLSWAWAVDQLLQQDPMATWDYQPPMQFGDTLMVFCSVSAFGKTMTCQMPVINNQNKAIANPNAMDVNTAMMRCLVKTISLFGLGLYIYAGEDIPEEDIVDLTKEAQEWVETISQCASMEELKNAYSSAYKALQNDKNSVALISKAKDYQKGVLMALQS